VGAGVPASDAEEQGDEGQKEDQAAGMHTSASALPQNARLRAVTRAQGAEAMLCLVCTTPPAVAGRTGSKDADGLVWRWPPARRLRALTSLLRMSVANISDSVPAAAGPGGGLEQGRAREGGVGGHEAGGVAGSCAQVGAGTVAAAAAAVGEAVQEVGLGDSVSWLALEALGGVFAQMAPPLRQTHGNGTSSAAERHIQARLSWAVMMLARVCARDMHIGCPVEGTENANVVGAVADMADALATRHSAAAACGYGQEFNPPFASSTALLLLKACAQGGGRVRGADIALRQLEYLAAASSVRAGLSVPQDSVRGSDCGQDAGVSLVLAALAAHCRFLHGTGENGGEWNLPPSSRCRTAPAQEAAALPDTLRWLSDGESVWGAALEVWDRLDAWGESARQQPAVFSSLAMVLEAAARAGGRAKMGNATWQLGAVAQLCIRAAALPQRHNFRGAPELSAEECDTGNGGWEASGSYSTALASLLAAVQACVPALGAHAGSVALVLSHSFSRRFGAMLDGPSLGALLSCYLASSRPSSSRGCTQSTDKDEVDAAGNLREAISRLLVDIHAHPGSPVTVPNVGDRLEWLRAGVRAVDAACYSSGHVLQIRRVYCPLTCGDLLKPRQAALAQDGSGEASAGAGARGRRILLYAVPALIEHVRALVRALRFEADKSRGAEAEVADVLSLLHSLVIADMSQQAANLEVVSGALLSASMLIKLNVTCPGAVVVAHNASAALRADSNVNGTGSEGPCPWRLGKLWSGVLFSPRMSPPLPFTSATDESDGSTKTNVWQARGASAAAGRHRARCMEIWVEMCLESGRQERRRLRHAHGDLGDGCRCGALQVGGLAEVRDALASWDSVDGPMSLKLVYVRMMFLLAPPESANAEQDKTPSPIGRIEALCKLLMQASRLIDSGAGRSRKMQEDAAKLVTRMVHLVASRFFCQLQSVKNLTASARRNTRGAAEKEVFEIAAVVQQHALRVAKLLEQMLLRCNHNQVGVATYAIEALGVMLSQLADVREQACKRAASASAPSKGADKEGIMKVEWYLLASVAQAAVQAWARPQQANLTNLRDPETGGGEGQSLTAQGPQANESCSLAVADTEDGPRGGMRWLSAEAATGLLRLLRKGIMTDEWQRRRVVRQAEVLVAYVAPHSLSDSLAAEMLLTLGGKHGGSSEQSAVLAMISRARSVDVASGKVLFWAHILSLCFVFASVRACPCVSACHHPP